MATQAKTIEEPKPIPTVSGLPLVGNTLEMAKDPAAFFVRCYRDYGPVYRVNVFGQKSYVIAGPEAGKFMNTKAARNGLRSKEFWQGLVDHHGASKTLTGVDGEDHQKMRAIMRDGFSRNAMFGRYHELTDIIDISLARDWNEEAVPVVEAFQYMIVHLLGEVMTGNAPLEYVRDIRVNILYILNVLVTKQRPGFMIHMPEFKRASKRVDELGQSMVDEFFAHAEAGTLPKNLLGDVMRGHLDDPELIQKRDLKLVLTGPYVAGLDTVANTLAAAVYGILKTPGVLEKVQAEADELFARDVVTERDVLGLDYIQSCLKEAMRLWPIAVAQMRTTNHDLEFEGYVVPKDETIFIGTSVPHFMEEFFPDPMKFDPDRVDRREHLKPGAYAPFGRGTHSCLGQSLAEVMMGICIARLFHRMNISLTSPDYVLKTKTAPTPGPAMSFKIKVDGERNPAKSLDAEILGEAA
ncbi:cytochrome P450 [Parasphingorhabdus halotolerans]|uniref:Cytochrome P450 n=1 Tax=Parasphingorhabdus halotolerans TaxID=2725558 RepID=A0A6H2DKN5_9SPHN|nr:cytochrome P450 [Parasphingorhabdus halotolerans]QJB68758.1 cytochrome P450 [Parasphingorhabdus halotolerans]